MPMAPGEYNGPGPDDDMGGGGYTPEMGDYNTFKANRRAYRSTFQPGGWRYDRNERENVGIGMALEQNPNMSQAQWDALLARYGIHNQKDMRQSRYKSLGMARDGSLLLDTNYHLTPEGFMDVATSDVDPASPTGKYRLQSYASNRNIARQAGRPFWEQAYGNAGLGTFQRWQRNGETGMQTDPATGLLFNTGPNGERTYYDQRGFRIDPRTGRRVGHYMYQGLDLGSYFGG